MYTILAPLRPFYRVLQGQVCCCRVYIVLTPSIKYQSFSVRVCSPPTLSLICWLTSSDVSVGALRAPSMADTVSAGALTVVEELVIVPSVNRTLPTSTAAEKSLLMGLATLESLSLSLGKIVTGVEVTWFCEVCAVARRQEPVSAV